MDQPRLKHDYSYLSPSRTVTLWAFGTMSNMPMTQGAIYAHAAIATDATAAKLPE